MRALRVAQHVVVGYHGTHLVALILVFNHRFISPNTNEPICKPHELYMDVACSYYCYRACGRETIKRFLEWARKQKAKAIRIYSTPMAAKLWEDSWGFRECETVLGANGKVRYGPSTSASLARRGRGIKETKDLPRRVFAADDLDTGVTFRWKPHHGRAWLRFLPFVSEFVSHCLFFFVRCRQLVGHFILLLQHMNCSVCYSSKSESNRSTL
jgi:hypothetical protein